MHEQKHVAVDEVEEELSLSEAKEADGAWLRREANCAQPPWAPGGLAKGVSEAVPERGRGWFGGCEVAQSE